MSRKGSQTFRQILIAVAPQNVQALERKAHAASRLARAYPEKADVFYQIEDRMIGKMSSIVFPRLSACPEYAIYERENGCQVLVSA